MMSNITKKGSLAKKVIIVGFIMVIFLCVIITILLIQKPKYLEISNIDLNTIKNGAYTGNADNGMVKATVSVEVKNGIIQNVSIIKHEHLLGKQAEVIIDDIMQQQSLEVDDITSATYSSNTIRKAVENALQKGE